MINQKIQTFGKCNLINQIQNQNNFSNFLNASRKLKDFLRFFGK